MKNSNIYVIQREDGKYYTGKGSKTWRSDPSWKQEIHSASFYKECYLDRGLRQARYKTDQKLTIIRVEIIEKEGLGCE